MQKIWVMALPMLARDCIAFLKFARNYDGYFLNTFTPSGLQITNANSLLPG